VLEWAWNGLWSDTVQWKDTMPLGRRVVDKEVEVDCSQFVSIFVVEVVCGCQGSCENNLSCSELCRLYNFMTG
jgi:hypothetical protein